MMLLYYFTHLLIFICINAQNETFILPLLKIIIPVKYYQKLIKKYSLSLQIIENNNIVNEYYINITYKFDRFFDFCYSEKFYYLNDTNFDLLPKENYNLILLIDSNLLNNKFSYNIRKIKELIKVIIIPSHLSFKKDKQNFINEFSIILIELKENLFNELVNKYIFHNYTNYYVKISSKKYEVFPYYFLYSLMFIIFLILLIFSLIYKYTIKKYLNDLKEVQLQFFKQLNNNIDSKIYIIFLLYIELNFFYKEEGFILDNVSFLKSLTIIFLIYNKAVLIIFVLNTFYGIGIFFKRSKIFRALNLYLVASIIIFYIFYYVFVSPLKSPQVFYIFSIIIYIPTFFTIIFYSINNLNFLFKVFYKLKKIERAYRIYGRTIRLKMFIVITQFIFFLIYMLFFLILHEYLLFKKGLFFEIEKDILFQCLDCSVILFISFIYIPGKYPVGFALNILIINERKNNKIQINSGNNYQTNIPKETLINEKEIKKFVRNNYQNYLTVLNPKFFFEKGGDNNDIYRIENNIKIGKLIMQEN